MNIKQALEEHRAKIARLSPKQQAKLATGNYVLGLDGKVYPKHK